MTSLWTLCPQSSSSWTLQAEKLQWSIAEEQRWKEIGTSNDHNVTSNDSHSDKNSSNDDNSFSIWKTDFNYSDYDEFIEDHMRTQKVDEMNAQSLNDIVDVDLVYSIYH